MQRLGNYLILFLCLITLVVCSVAGPVHRSLQKNPLAGVVIPPTALLRNGDVILREGNSFISEVMKNFSLSDKHYSHAGLVHIEKDGVYVYHILPGEKGHTSTMLKEPISLFCNRMDNSGYAVYRTVADGEKIDRVAGELYKKQPKFDTEFSLLSDEKLYCTELVYKVIRMSNPDKKVIPLTQINGHTFVACDNLYADPQTKLIFSHQY